MTLRPILRPTFAIEPLESRIAPAGLALENPLPDIVAGSGKTGATIDLSEIVDSAALYPHRTLVEFTTNVDIDANTPGLQAGKIVLELFDDLAPLTVQNFLAYVTNTNKSADYDNTFFHRSGQGFVLQGGGFETPGVHIPVLPTVHNEPDAVNRPNVLGTVAMAKVGGDPNSATSEWFINLGNNTGLDTQNGGFTVFARVIEGLELAQTISTLPYYNAGGDGTGTPTQNYNADPDNNPNTPSPLPTGDQLIRIVDAKVVQPTGNSAGVTFTVESVTPVGSTPSNLLTATVAGQTLNLKYTPGKSGFVDVTVKASMEGSDPVFDTFRVDVRPNLIVDVVADGLQGVVIPGDTATIKLSLINTGAATAIGTADILIGLIKTTAIRNSQGQITGFAVDPTATPITIAHLEGVSLNLAGGKSANFTTKVTIPTSGLAPEDSATDIEGTVFQLVAQVTPKTGDIATSERFADDNAEQLGRQHHALNRFGTFTSDFAGLFGGRTNASLTYLDNRGTDATTDDVLVTWSVKGSGFGRITLTSSQGVMVEVDGTNVQSALTAKVAKRGEQIAVEGMQFLTPLGTANLSSVSVEDYLFAAGGVKSLSLGDILGQATMLIGSFPPDNTTQTTLKFGRVQDLTLESSMPIASLTAIEWRDTPGTEKDFLTALGLGTLKIAGGPGVRGDFEANVTIHSDEPVKSISVTGFLRNSTIQSSSSIGTVTLGGMDSSNLFLGVDEMPDAADDFVDALTLSRFTIKGIKGFTGDLFIDSNVAAATLGTIRVKDVATTSGDDSFGFVADAIKSYNRAGIKTASKTSTLGILEERDNYRVQAL